jgi:hypothetical protein
MIEVQREMKKSNESGFTVKPSITGLDDVRNRLSSVSDRLLCCYD